MSSIASMKVHHPELLDVVALLAERPDLGLPRGAVGTVVEPLDDVTSLVEFADDSGQTRAIIPCRHSELRVVSKTRG